MAELRWLGAVRHAESVGNVAATDAESRGLQRLDLSVRDPDVPLSPRGEEQAAAVGKWLAALGEPPDVVVVSPYVRTAQTAQLATAGCEVPLVYDERLRDRDLGILDLWTARGVVERFPEEAERRKLLGKFYYRPPGGESWADVALRLRTLFADLRRDRPGRRVLLVTHDVVVQMIRYLVEELTERDVVESSRRTPIANASVSVWRGAEDGRLRPELFNDVAHLVQEGTVPTHEEGVRGEPL